MEHEKNIIVTSTAFENGGIIPVKFTGYGEDVSPGLTLSGLDENAKSIAIVMDDVDHPIKPNFNHWVIWNILPSEKIQEGIPRGKVLETLGGAVQGRAYGKHRYRGPKPPFGWSHRYRYHVYVLDTKLDLDPGTRKDGLLAATEGHIIQYGVLEGRYR
ncbi:YbhB/YbcL family Raf kinase inhibitor-like protein [Christensenellaceae bacterium OttesenSCG-928-K19]|nr:YbhB/YbcL family Raf kinase inhibitor-like protein [Christensenellaceae bacterium OttesenSCG-928-K19]